MKTELVATRRGLPVAGGHKTSLTVGNGGNSLEIELLRMAGDESDSG